jgi:hypothetical protein
MNRNDFSRPAAFWSPRCFAIRGDIKGDFESIFQLNKTNVGLPARFWGFGLD